MPLTAQLPAGVKTISVAVGSGGWNTGGGYTMFLTSEGSVYVSGTIPMPAFDRKYTTCILSEFLCALGPLQATLSSVITRINQLIVKPRPNRS